MERIMLLEVRISNFRSFKEEQTISLVAMDGYQTLPQYVEQIGNTCFGHNSIICDIKNNVIHNHTKDAQIDNNEDNNDKIEVRKSALIYGANASGKSNIIWALSIVGDICVEKEFWKGTTSFFHNDQPSKISYVFLNNNCICEYIISWDKDRIVSEELLNGNKQIIFSRNYQEGQYQCSHLTAQVKDYFRLTPKQVNNYKANLKNTKGVLSEEEIDSYIEDYIIGDFTKITSNIGDRNLLLSEFALSGYEAIQEILIFLRYRILIRTPTMSQDHLNLQGYDLNLVIQTFGDDEKQVSNVMKTQDHYKFKFSNYDDMFNKFGADIQGISFAVDPNNPRQGMPYSYKEYNNTIHRFELMAEESSGTVIFLKYYSLFHVLEQCGGGVLVIDELDAHFHPLMVIEFLRYVNQKSNKNVVQVIATIHNTALLSRDIMKDDQIYLVEKQNHSSKIASFADYDLSDDQKNDLEKAYLSGVLGAVPDLHAIDISIADDKNNIESTTNEKNESS